MDDIKEQHFKNAFSLWTNWLVATGALVAVAVAGLWISCTWLPLLAFGLEIALYIMSRSQAEREYPPCSLILFVATRALFWSGVIMVAINLLYSYRVVHRIFDPDLLNASIPYIPILIIAPVSAAIAMTALFMGGRFMFCRLCRQHNGTVSERGFLGKTFNQEGRYQMTLMANLFTIVTVATWIYYSLKYININLNQADAFMFAWFPALVWLFGGIHVGVRYSAFWNYYDQNLSGSAQQIGRYTSLRMILISGDRILLKMPSDLPDQTPDERKGDTPCHLRLRYHKEVSFELACRSFSNMVHIEDLDMRFLYSNTRGNPDFNMFHYAAFITEEQKPLLQRYYDQGCRWVSMHEIQRLLNLGQLNPFLCAEIIRIHTVAMAWKTYTPEGKRIYKIKHYHPTFHIEDMKDWDVDFNDEKWLYIALNNADVPFWRLRRLWHHHVSGVRKRQ